MQGKEIESEDIKWIDIARKSSPRGKKEFFQFLVQICHYTIVQIIKFVRDDNTLNIIHQTLEVTAV